MTLSMKDKPEAQRSPHEVSKPKASDHKLKNKDKQIVSLQKEVERWRMKVAHLDEMVMELQARVKEMKMKPKLRISVCLPPPHHYPIPRY